jgi:LacI family transcriptional regulator
VPTTVASKINTIGAVIKRDPTEHPQLDPFYYAVLCGIEDECERLGINLMYASLHVNEHSEAVSWTPLLENGDLDGLVIVGVVFNDASVTARIPQHLPVVVVDAVAKGLDCDLVNTHNLRGAYDAVSYLIKRGHTRIGLIGSTSLDPEPPGITERHQGYLKALADHGIQQTYIQDSQLHAEHAYKATHQLLEQHADITAIFACNDDITPHIIRALNDRGLCVPEDISLVGFDDTEVAVNAQPPLTTMRVEKGLMGALAVRQLYERATNNERPSITTLLGTTLIERSSVTDCPALAEGEPVHTAPLKL